MTDSIAAEVSRAIGVELLPGSASPLAGGSIHRALRYRTARGAVFLKVGPLAAMPMFVAEAEGLRVLADARAVRVPSVLASGEIDGRSYLCLEWLDLVPPTYTSATQLGARLANLHRCRADEHGFHQDNFIGRTPQINARAANWVSFLRERRLRPQLELARANNADARTLERGERLIESLDAFFTSYTPQPSLLHGDLWGGNWGTTRDGEPAIFDPASYYGDRETDLAMTRLFGGFGAEFYAAYDAAWPLDAGATARVELYNLYHVLNHYNLFGGGYLAQARAMIERLLAAIG
jgi:protein-ribulosamine 3-kinase